MCISGRSSRATTRPARRRIGSRSRWSRPPKRPVSSRPTRRSSSRLPATRASRSRWSPSGRATGSRSSCPTTRVRSGSVSFGCSAPRSSSPTATRARTARSRWHGRSRRIPRTTCRSSTGTRRTHGRMRTEPRARSSPTSPRSRTSSPGWAPAAPSPASAEHCTRTTRRIQVVAAEPELGDLVYGLRSLDEGFVPPIFDPAEVNRKFLVSSDDALRATRELTSREGIFSGISSGAVVHVAQRIAAESREGRHRLPARRRRLEVPLHRSMGRRSRDGGEEGLRVPVVVSDPRPIGVFDSGVGGLTVARAIIDLLPHEPLIYVGDSARFPYGSQPVERIRRYALEIAEYLVRARREAARDRLQLDRGLGDRRHRGERRHPRGRRGRTPGRVRRSERRATGSSA